MNRSFLRPAALGAALACSFGCLALPRHAHANSFESATLSVTGVIVGGLTVIPTIVTAIGTSANLSQRVVPLGWSTSALATGTVLIVSSSLMIAGDALALRYPFISWAFATPQLIISAWAVTVGAVAIASKAPPDTQNVPQSASQSAVATRRLVARGPRFGALLPWFSSNAAGLSTGFVW